MPRVWNKRDPNVPKGAVYVGRPSKWGNPFFIGARVTSAIDGDPTSYTITREDAVRLYRVNLSPELRAAAQAELRGKDLVCWCAPLSCHADVLLEVANS